MQVRQVEENDPEDTVHSTTSTVASSAVRAVQFLGDVPTFEPAVVEPFIKADMPCTDHDRCWTVCPEINQCCCAES